MHTCIYIYIHIQSPSELRSLRALGMSSSKRIFKASLHLFASSVSTFRSSERGGFLGFLGVFVGGFLGFLRVSGGFVAYFLAPRLNPL